MKKALETSETERLINEFVKSGKQYRYDGNNLIKKVFNNGRGNIGLVKLYPEYHIIVVNKGFLHPADMKRINPLAKETSSRIIYRSLGYPDWYFKSLGLNGKEIELAKKGKLLE